VARLSPDVRTDAVLTLQLIARLLADHTMEKLREAGFDDLRESDGYVFQHLVPGAIPITELALRLGVTQQAASKTVVDLETRGYVARRSDPDDARLRLVELSERGARVIKSTRTIRAALEKKLLAKVDDADKFAAALDSIAASLGAGTVLLKRNLAPPH
jgi:DNA-binding MarR family transcriptional regulator